MYIFGYLRLDAVLQSRHAPCHFFRINVDGLLVSLCASSCNLSRSEVREPSAVTVTGKRQSFIPRPLLDDVSEAHRYFAATPADFQRRQRCDIVSSQDKAHSAFISLHLHPCRRATARVLALARHLCPYIVANFKQDALDFIHDRVIDYAVVSNCHFLRVFSRFKPFFLFSNIIYQLSNKNRL